MMLKFLIWLNPYRRIAELERRLAELEQSTTGRFAVVMASNKKIHGNHQYLTNRIEKIAKQVKDFTAQPKS